MFYLNTIKNQGEKSIEKALKWPKHNRIQAISTVLTILGEDREVTNKD